MSPAQAKKAKKRATHLSILSRSIDSIQPITTLYMLVFMSISRTHSMWENQGSGPIPNHVSDLESGTDTVD
jgi:hypothetical protein